VDNETLYLSKFHTWENKKLLLKRQCFAANHNKRTGTQHHYEQAQAGGV
jgi:hypothetical protein